MTRLLDRATGLAFPTLAVICLLNLNGMARMWTGVEQVFSVPLLLCCVVMIIRLPRVPLSRAAGVPGLLILSALISYIAIGIVVAIVTGVEQRSDSAWHLVRHVNSIVVILAAAVGGSILRRRLGDERLMVMVLTILVFSCVVILASPLLLSVYADPPNSGTYRLFGAFGDPNEAGLVASFTVALALTFIGAARYRTLALGALVVATAALIGTFSRTAMLAMPALWLWNMLAGRPLERRRLAGTLLLGAIGAVTLAGLAELPLRQSQLLRLDSVLQVYQLSSTNEGAGDVPLDSALGERSGLWAKALDQALAAPFFGHGLGRLHRLDGAWYNADGVLLGAHNQYLVLLGEAGFLPFVLFVLFLGSTLRRGWRTETGALLSRAASGWALILAVFCFSFHGMLTLRANCFLIGLSLSTSGSSRRTSLLSGP